MHFNVINVDKLTILYVCNGVDLCFLFVLV